MNVKIQQALSHESEHVASILHEAAEWLVSQNQALWRPEHISPISVQAHVRDGIYFIARVNDEPAGVIRLQLEDPDFWPDAKPGEALYIHRLAVRRQFAGGGVSKSLLQFAVDHAETLGKPFVRLDTAADRPKLRNIYEQFGFRFYDLKDMGFIVVARYQLPIRPRSPLDNSPKP